jgi:hypothetical protein
VNYIEVTGTILTATFTGRISQPQQLYQELHNLNGPANTVCLNNSKPELFGRTSTIPHDFGLVNQYMVYIIINGESYPAYATLLSHEKHHENTGCDYADFRAIIEFIEFIDIKPLVYASYSHPTTKLVKPKPAGPIKYVEVDVDYGSDYDFDLDSATPSDDDDDEVEVEKEPEPSSTPFEDMTRELTL